MLGCHRQANQSAAILRHENNGLRRNLLSGDSQVTFVFSIFIIDNDHHLSRAYRRNGIFDACEQVRAAVGFSNNLKSSSHEEGPPQPLIWSVVLKARLQLAPVLFFRESETSEGWIVNN